MTGRMRHITGCVIFMSALLLQCAGATAEHELITYTTDDGATVEGALFKAGGPRAVLLAHGAVFDKESWFPMAERLAEAGVSALAIDFRGYGNSRGGEDARAYHQDILGGVAYLKNQGYKHIALAGGSMGAMAILRALAASHDPAVDKVLLLAPPAGQAVASEDTEKLFIVSDGDRAASATRAIHNQSAEPKRLEILPGDAHAQHIFKTRHAEALRKLMMDFLSA